MLRGDGLGKGYPLVDGGLALGVASRFPACQHEVQDSGHDTAYTPFNKQYARVDEAARRRTVNEVAASRAMVG